MGFRYASILFILFVTLVTLSFKPEQGSEDQSLSAYSSRQIDVHRLAELGAEHFPRRSSLLIQDYLDLRNACVRADQLFVSDISADNKQSPGQVRVELISIEEARVFRQKTRAVRSIQQMLEYHQHRLDKALPSQWQLNIVLFLFSSSWGISEPYQLKKNVGLYFNDVIQAVGEKDFNGCVQLLEPLLNPFYDTLDIRREGG